MTLLMRTSASLLVLATIPSVAVSTTFLSGNLPPLLTESDSPYVVLADLTLHNAESTFEPGVVLQFTAGTRLILRGTTTLTAQGTQAKPIEISGFDGDTWKGIELLSDTNGSGTLATHLFEWINFANAEEAYYVRYFLHGSAVTFRDCVIDGVGQLAGLRIENRTSMNPQQYAVDIQRVTVTGVSGTAFYLGSRGDSVGVHHCTAQDSQTGFFFDSGQGLTVASNLTATGNDIGIQTWVHPTISNSLVSGNIDGIRVDNAVNAHPTFADVIIVDNSGVGVTIGADDNATFNLCEIHDNAVRDVEVQASVQIQTTIDFRDCYWGAVTTAEMEVEGTFSDIAAIYDWWDDSSKSLVDYEGFAGGPTSAGAALQTSSWAGIKNRYRGR